jgi:hypothetical protein
MKKKTYEAQHFRFSRPGVQGICDVIYVPRDGLAVGLFYEEELPCTTGKILYLALNREIAANPIETVSTTSIDHETLLRMAAKGNALDDKKLKLSEEFDGSTKSLVRILSSPLQ